VGVADTTRFAGEEEETRSSVKYLNFCLASGAPNIYFTAAVKINNNKLKTTTL
jgi:hypothetical protein